MRLLLLCVTVTSISLASAIGGKKNVVKAFKEYYYLPELIPDDILNVYYPTAEMCLGDVISQTRILVTPIIGYTFKPGCNYTVVFFDPDTPSARAPVLRSYLNYLATDIVLKGKSDYEIGETIAGYIPCTPYSGTGYHRFTVLLYEQTEPLNATALASKRLAIKRYKFDTVAFAEEFGLKGPVAGNFARIRTRAVYDEYYCDGLCSSLAEL